MLNNKGLVDPATLFILGLVMFGAMLSALGDAVTDNQCVSQTQPAIEQPVDK